MSARHRFLGIGVLLAASAGAQTPPAAPAASSMLQAMQHELNRNLTALRAQPLPPYFLSYEVSEVHKVTIRSSFGAITENERSRRRALVVDLRVGTPQFDNTHSAHGDFPDFAEMMSFGDRSVDVPIDDDTAALQAVLWLQTDRKYRQATRQLASVRASAVVSVQSEDTSPDFSVEPAVRYADTVAALTLDSAAWEAKLRSYTAPFRRFADIYDADATLDAAVETRW